MSPTDAPTLDALLIACAGGDKAALNQIYAREGGRMLAVAERIVKRRAAAEDAVQESFIRIWRSAARFDPDKGTAATWIYTILRNRALTLLRDEARVEPVDDALDAEIADEAETPEETIARLSDADALKRCLERLDMKRRMAITLAYVHGLSHAELAGRLNIPLGTVKSWMRRSLMTLRECLQ